MKESAVRKGFTLVELLIVIVVIGILSAMMMLSSTEAVSSARAADIISDLRNLKTAALAFYMDNIDEIDAVKGNIFPFDEHPDIYLAYEAKVWQYMGSKKIRIDGSNNAEEYHYSFGSETHTANTWYGGAWYVWCKVTDDRVREKLASRAVAVGLCGSSRAYSGNPDNVKKPYKALKIDDYKYVGLRIK